MSEEQGPSRSNISEESEMSAYKKEALNVVTFNYVLDKEDFESGKAISFKPEMAHQIFGESESIFGYRTLSINLNYLHNSCKCYLDIDDSGKVNTEVVKPDDILKSLNPWLPQNFITSSDEFMNMLENENHEHIFGEVIKTFEKEENRNQFSNNPIKCTYKITQNNVDNKEFTEFHSRFETFIVWFIDAANFIDLEDDHWSIFYIYEEFEHPIKKTIYRSPVGYCSVYKFYAYPYNIRPRISQFFILPPYQRKGLGTILYETVASTLRDMTNSIDVTVEGPTISFQKIRDLDDCFLVHKELQENKINFLNTLSSKIFEIMKIKKIGKKQCQRVYDILGLYYSSEKGQSCYTEFVNLIKERISDNNKKQSKPSKRFCNKSRVSIKVDKTDMIEQEYKRHLDDIEPSLKYLQKKLKDKFNNPSLKN